MDESTKRIIENLIKNHSGLYACADDILTALGILIECYRKDKKLLICGNGGSAADAQHIACELMKPFLMERPLGDDMKRRIRYLSKDGSDYLIDNLKGGLAAVSLTTDTSMLTACLNDMSPDIIFAQQVFVLGEDSDVLLAISTSGTSKNVIHACETARAKGMASIALTGASGGALADICDALICVPEEEAYKVQELHAVIYHGICMALENEFFG